MHTEDLIVRCYIKPAENEAAYVGVCVDLCLAAQGDSPEEVKEKLYHQMIDYVQEAFSEPQYTAQLLRRKAPMSQRLTYRYIHAWHTARETVKCAKSKICDTFDLALPMGPQFNAA